MSALEIGPKILKSC